MCSSIILFCAVLEMVKIITQIQVQLMRNETHMYKYYMYLNEYNDCTQEVIINDKTAKHGLCHCSVHSRLVCRVCIIIVTDVHFLMVAHVYRETAY